MKMISPYIYAGIESPHNIETHDTIINAVINAVIGYYHITAEQLTAKTRKREIVEPRQIACYLIKKNSRKTSLVKIGQVFNQDHSTVFDGINTIKNLIQVDADFRDKVIRIERNI